MSRAHGAWSTTGGWFGEEGSASFGWLSGPSDGSPASGVLVLPPVGYGFWSSYSTLRALAEALAGAGHLALRVHYGGTGNAAGSQWDTDRLGAWEHSVRDGAALLRRAGCEELTLVGAHLGATLALQLASELDASAVVAWKPVVNGRREARGLRVRSVAIPDDELVGLGSLSFAGTVLSTASLQDIAAIDLLEVEHGPERALVLDGAGADPLVARLAGIGTAAERLEVAGEEALTVPAEEAEVAAEVVAAVVAWVQPSGPASGGAPIAGLLGDLDDGTIREEVVSLADAGLVGIACSPAGHRAPEGTVVLLNSGSEAHVGPGRAWVELARHLAAHGHRVLRVDFRGWGESPDDGLAPGRPYDAHGIEDTVALVDALEAQGAGPVVLVGLCAGAWIALKAVLERDVAGVVALNPQLYWQPGDPVDALLTTTRARRTPERELEEEGRRTGLWDARDAAGERIAPAAWLDELAGNPATVAFLYAEGDDGLEFLHNRLARRVEAVLADGGLSIVEVEGIDHAMHRAWLRPAMFGAISTAVRTALDAHQRAAL